MHLSARNSFYSFSDAMSVGKVGSEGDLFPPKEIRLQAGLIEGQKVVYRVVNGRLIVEKLFSPEEILKKSSKVIVSFEEIKRDRLQLTEDTSK